MLDNTLIYWKKKVLLFTLFAVCTRQLFKAIFQDLTPQNEADGISTTTSKCVDFPLVYLKPTDHTNTMRYAENAHSYPVPNSLNRKSFIS